MLFQILKSAEDPLADTLRKVYEEFKGAATDVVKRLDAIDMVSCLSFQPAAEKSEYPGRFVEQLLLGANVFMCVLVQFRSYCHLMLNNLFQPK